jgi:hypothetical protein
MGLGSGNEAVRDTAFTEGFLQLVTLEMRTVSPSRESVVVLVARLFHTVKLSP